MNSVKLLSPAKINLYLQIAGVRGDGHHNLISVIQPVDLFDELFIDVYHGSGLDLIIEGDKNIPIGDDNLVIKAAKAYLEYTDTRSRILFRLTKNIPTQAGLGGGSGNAAATLYGLNKIFKSLEITELINIATQIGSDIPFFINCRTSLVKGIGDKLTILNSFPLLNYIIIKPPFGLSTKLVYEKWDSMHNTNIRSDIQFDIEEYTNEFRIHNYHLLNDLEKPAILLDSRIQKIKDLLINLGCDKVSMTGAGSAVFAVLKNYDEAEYIFEYLTNSYEYKTYLCKGISGWHRL